MTQLTVRDSRDTEAGWAPMAYVKVRHLIAKCGRADSTRRFWEPGGRLRSVGWRTVRLDDDLQTAIGQAEAINAALDGWRMGVAAIGDAPYGALIFAAGPRDLIAESDRTRLSPARPSDRPEILKELIEAYRLSEEFRDLRVMTRKSYDDNLRTLDRWAGDAPLSVLTPERFTNLWKSLRRKTPTKAKGVISMGRILLGWARRNAGYKGYRLDGILVSDNPAARLNIRTSKPRRNEEDLWSDEDIAVFAETADALGRSSVGIAVALNSWLGQRESDVIKITWGQYHGGVIAIEQGKTGVHVNLPVGLVAVLTVRIERLRKRAQNSALTATTLLVNERTGLAWKDSSFHHAFSEVRSAAAKKSPHLAKKQFMLLRHTAIVRLAESGCTSEEISAISGHSLTSVAEIMERYHVRTKKLAEKAFRKRLDAGLQVPSKLTTLT